MFVSHIADLLLIQSDSVEPRFSDCQPLLTAECQTPGEGGLVKLVIYVAP